MLKGRIDRNLEVYATLVLEDIELLEREKVIRGIMVRPVMPPSPATHDAPDEEILCKKGCYALPRKPRRKKGYMNLKPDESLFTLHLRSAFTFEGLPANKEYWNRKTYDLGLNLGHLQQLRQGQSIVKREPAVPVNYISVSLEKVVRSPSSQEQAAQSQTQSL